MKEILLDINGSFGAPGKKININFTKAKTKFCLSLHYNAENSYLFVNGKETYKFKASNKTFHLKEVCMIFQLIMKLLVNLTF